MNEFQLQLLETEDLQTLYSSIKQELNKRRKRLNLNKRKEFIKTLDLSKFDSNDSLNREINKINSGLFSLPNILDPFHCREKYFSSLMEQDWSDIFEYEEKTGEFYVYAHVNPSERIFVKNKEYGGNYKGTPFYIGKGKGNRAYDLKRNQGHGKKIKEVLSNGWSSEDIVHIAFENLSENRAYEIESKLIYFFGSIYEKGKEKNGTLYNLDIPKTPVFLGEMKKKITLKQFENKKIQGNVL